jgi:hypothetical protein
MNVPFSNALTRFVFSGALAIISAIPAAAGMIDNFSDSTSLTTAPSYTAGSMLGGERDAIITGNPPPSFQATGGLATFTSGGELISGGVIAQLVYDGVDGSSGNIYGLGGVDLTDSGASDRFLLQVNAVAGPVDLTLRIWESGTAYSSYVFSGVNTSGLYQAPFASFSAFGAGGNFAAANAVGLFVQGLDTPVGAGSESITFDYLSTGVNPNSTAPGPIPEPSSVALMGLGLAACGFLARRKARS